MKLKITTLTIFLSLSCLLWTSCIGNPSKNEEKTTITVTIEPQRYFTEAIAGDRFKVVSMVPKGASPETYDPIPQQLVALRNSKAYFRIGHIGFEKVWMDKLMNNTPHIQVFDTSKGIDFIFDSHHHAHDEKECSATENEQSCCTSSHESTAPEEEKAALKQLVEGIEPHVWNSTTNALIIAENTYKALCQLDKDNQAYYLARYDSLCNHILQVDSLIRQQLDTPAASKSFMIYHPALSYFARDYGLKQIAIEENGKEPSPAHLKSLIDLCQTTDVQVIFVQPEFDKRNAETIMQQTGTQIISINPLNYQWEEEMINIAKALSTPASKASKEDKTNI